MRFAVWILVTTATIPVGHALLHSGLGSHDEMRLVENLLHGYNSLIRPVGNLTQTVNVKFGLAMIQLINVDEKNQIMKSNVWLRMLWNDYQLQWDPSEYGGINVIRILSHKVWKPDIVLFNNADGRYEVSYKPNVVIFSIGDVMWIPPAIYKSSCTINVLYFPFDEQKCFMKFGSWTFNGDQVVLDWYEGQEKVDLSDYVNSGTWDIIASPGVYNRTWDNIEGHHKAQITFTLRIRRKTLFYTVNLIIPCVLISFLSVCVFYLPADAGEKMTMCISILLALVVFLLLVSKILPPNSNTIPLIAKYLLFTFIMNIITIVITVVIINWNFKTPRTNTMPKWLRTVFLNYLPRLLLMKRPQKHLRRCERAGISSGSKITWQKEFSRTFRDISTFHKPPNSPANKPGDERDDTGEETQLADRVCMIKRNKQRFVRRCLSSEHLEFHTAPRHQSSANPAFGSTFPEGSIDASSIYRDENIDTPSASFYRRPRPVRIQQHLSLQEAQTSMQSKTLGRKSFDWKRTDNKHSASSDDLLLIFNPPSTQQNFDANRSSVNPAFQPRFCRQLDEFRKLKAEEFSGKFPRGRRARDSSLEVEELQTPQERGEPFDESPEFITIPSNTPTYPHHYHHHHHYQQYPHDIQSEQRFGFHSQKSCLKRRILISGNSSGAMSPEAAKAVDAVRFIAAHLKNEDEYNEILDDWRYIASVIDRLQLIIFLLVTVVGTAAILFNAPHIFEFVDQDEIKRRIIESSDGTLN